MVCRLLGQLLAPVALIHQGQHYRLTRYLSYLGRTLIYLLSALPLGTSCADGRQMPKAVYLPMCFVAPLALGSVATCPGPTLHTGC